ncbi:MAG: hypothetical protein A3G25_05180 [Betaproteobacteria bacterium RIFCSPLOWO2_12_FULL_63_13]|nr:MAG: hypothetical protein A3G25_05180 [Betaproteobacteria bacterium RIFCSPLOWO2_12_FULL_63_13]
MKKTSVFLWAAAAAAVVLGGPVRAETAVLKAASFLPEKASFGWPFYRWVKEVNKSCAGQVRIDVLAPGSIKAFEQPNAVKNGVIDMMSGPATYYKGTMVEGDTMTLADLTVSEMRKNGALEFINKLHNEKMNVQFLTYFGDGIPFHIYTRKEIKNGRFDGFSIRTAPIYDTMLRELGAKTVTIAPPEVYTALERGTVDGYGWPIWGIADFGWHKHTKYRVEPGFFKVEVGTLINLDRWKKMSDAQRGCLNKMALEWEKVWPAWRDSYTAKEIKKQDDAGVKAVNLGPEFRKRAHDLYWDALEKASPDNVRKLKKLLLK